jgi:KaiC/GvpD/RAD55 family RecA-like ATPase
VPVKNRIPESRPPSEAKVTAKRTLNLPEIVSVAKFRAGPIERRKIVIAGLLKKKSKMSITAPSKIGKTWLLLDLAITIVNGGLWLGRFRCQKGNVLYVSLELHDDDLDDRFAILADNLKRSTEGMDLLQLRGHAAPVAEIVDGVLERVAKSGQDYDIIIVDPVYKVLGDLDENGAKDINQLMNHLERMAENTGIVISHHHSKGNKSRSNAGDRSSGSGVFTRDPDTILELQPKDGDENKIDVHVKLRGFPRIAPFVIAADGDFQFKVTTDKVTTGEAAKEPVDITRTYEVLEFLNNLPDKDKGARHKDLIIEFCGTGIAKNKGLGWSKDQLNRTLRPIKKFGLADHDEESGFYSISVEGEEELKKYNNGEQSRKYWGMKFSVESQANVNGNN